MFSYEVDHCSSRLSGHANYSTLVPEHSYIDVRDFPGPRELAEYLDYLDQNPEEYLKYFWWTTAYQMDRHVSKQSYYNDGVAKIRRRQKAFLFGPEIKRKIYQKKGLTLEMVLNNKIPAI